MTLQRDEELIAVMREGWDDFQRYPDTETPPPRTDADAVEWDDPARCEAALAYIDRYQASSGDRLQGTERACGPCA